MLPVDLQPDDLDAEYQALLWEHERRRRKLRIRAVIAAIVVVAMLMVTVLPSIVRALRDRDPQPTQPTGVRALEIDPIAA